MDPTYAKLLKARSEVYGYWAGGSAVVALILMLPKDPAAQGYRLVLTACFFGGIITLLWGLTRPLQAFLGARCVWRYRDAGPALEHTGKLYAYALANYIAGAAWVLIALVSITALRVLGDWPQLAFLAPAHSLLVWGWWLALLALPLYLVGASQQLRDLVARGKALAEQELTSGFVPPKESEAGAGSALASEPAVQVMGPGRFRAGGHDWVWDDFFQNLIVFGQPGSGKTVCVLNALLEGLLAASEPPAAGLFLDPKGDFRDKLRVLCRRQGREADLLILDPTQPQTSLCWNPFDNDDDEIELAGGFTKVMETLGTRDDKQPFWIQQASLFIQHAIALLRASNSPGTPPSLAQVSNLAGNEFYLRARLLLANNVQLLHATDASATLVEAVRMIEDETALGEAMAAYFEAGRPANAMTQLVHDWWDMAPELRRHVCAQARAIQLASAGDGVLPPAGESFDLARNWFLFTWVPLVETTRSVIQAELQHMLKDFLASPYRQIFGERSTVSLGAALDEGKLLYVYMPIAEWPVMSRVVCTFIKIAFQREVLRPGRRGKPRPSLFLCDEYQAFFTPDFGGKGGDEDFLARSRESNHANIIATQNLLSLLKQTADDKPVMNLLGLCATKIFLRNNDDATNDYGSKVFGERLETLTGTQSSTGGVGLRTAASGSSSLSSNTQYGAAVRKEVFTGLAEPSRAEGIGYAESMTWLGARGPIGRVRQHWKVHPIQ
ncbi:MAG: type IV secretory system conjugative DNA transfer family protein [Chromatiaceae bacterium]|nr:type IV secretory system conjugative DNA transfer family protein [Chromatiaceae bacterium]